jgi:hypothetical protein
MIEQFPKITSPGLYQISHEHYHSDPIEGGSLSSSGAYTLANDCPAAYAYERVTKQYKRVFDLGNASHLITLEPDLYPKYVVIIEGKTKDGKPSDGYQTADAKMQRDNAYSAGKIPLLKSEDETIRAMRDVLWKHPIGRAAFREGKPEQSIFWKDPESGIWCRTRPDWVPTQTRYLINWKSAVSAHPDDIAKQIFNLGYFAKSSWEMDGLEAVTGERPQRFCLLVQAKTPPHLITPVWLHADDLAWGSILNRYARGVYAWCGQRGEWPGYQPELDAIPTAFDTIRMPNWAVRQLEDRQLRGEFKPPVLTTEKEP